MPREMDGFCSNQVRDYCKSCNSSDYKRHGCSKAQACLNKILHIISSIEPPPVKDPSLKSLAADGGGDGFIESNSGGDEYFGGKRKGFDIDLNMSLVGPSWESGESTESLVENGDFSACSFVYKEEEEEQQQQQQQEKTTDGCSDITNSQVDSVQEEEEELKRAAARGGGGGGNDCLGLLIAAAELISSGDDNNNNNKKQVMMSHLDDDDDDDDDDDKNNKKWRVDEGDTSAVVRSTRGRRSQVLPHRYRDSVVLLEPWKRLKTTTTTANTRSRYN